MREYSLCMIVIAAFIASQLDSTLALQCYSCTSTTNDTGNCLTSPSTQTSTACETECYTQITAGTLTRGCLTTGAACTLPSCSTCKTDNCNVNLVCQECLGEENCATTNVTLTQYNAVCPKIGQVCVNQLNGNQTVTRQCGDACAAGTESTCSSCSASLCNVGLFPANRRQCYNCTGENCNAVSNTLVAGCSQIDAGCFTTGTSASNMTRGCTSATTEIKCASDSTDPSCLVCNSDFCNSPTYEREAGSCIICENCAAQQVATDAKSCGQAKYNQEVGCYTITSGTNVNRGCLNTLESGCSTTNACTSCSENGCNVAAGEFTCIKCISNEDTGCWSASDPNTLPVVDCPNGTCYSGVWNELGVRGCFTAASLQMQYQCNAKVEVYQCDTCTESMCNKLPFNGAGALRHVGVVGMLMGVVIALRSAL
ncbi:major surface trophozoite antigen 11 [Drosophila simulans]|uniref:GD21791 n=1 Tax=Drosophila simulans TaxID=7240 RepID=B4Q9D9_DROSI|nr:major surface trophozoite antigen 11 [Drosophila simulans]EDX05446.1 GD21791 [Drosophila simulans]KMY90913.1 uncharacterized protein Dsimw501_GD21791 [Drosophila simulans]